ncbi:MAG: ATP-binding protein [Vulcanimicrobiaceae bacterium]
MRSAHHEPDEALFADKSIVRWIAKTEFDAARFDELAGSNAISDKRAALNVYGGDFLEGTYEEWAVRERDRLAGLYESVLADLVAQAQDVDAARLLLARNPFHEDAYAMLIEEQLDANRPATAAELIAQYRTAMREISAEPSAEFQKRFAGVQELGTVQRAARRVAVTKPHQTGRAIETNLPTQLTSFVGREDTLAELKEVIRRSRLVTLVGTGGIGKTRLAIHAATDLRIEFKDGVWFVDLATVSEPQYIVSAIASVLGISTASLDRALQDTLITAVQHRQMLLILDNCEHLIGALVPVVAALLRSCCDLRVLATSREPLNTEGEDVIRLSALPVDDAVALFVERARAAHKQFALSDRNASIVAAICRRLDGIPLAIELAAPRVSALSLKRLQQKLEEHFNILTSGDMMTLPRHKTVRALIDWSYDLLSPQEQTLLRLAGVFVGGFTLDAAAALFGEVFAGDEVLDVVASLVGKSLVLVETDAECERYSLLQTTQQYARERLRETGELSWMREQHMRYFLNLARQADGAYGTANAREWLQNYRPEIDNLRVAIEYSFRTGDVLSGAALIAAIRELWQELGLYAEGMHRAQQATEALGEDAPLALLAALWLVVAQLGNAIHLTSQSRESAQRALEAFEKLGDEPHLAYALQSLGFALIRSGAQDEAEVALLRAQALAERLGNRRVIARVLLRRGHNAYAAGVHEQGLALYERGLQLARAIGDDHYAGYVLGHMANAYFQLHDHRRSISYGRAALQIFQQRKDAAKESNALANLAECHFALGELAEAKETARASIGKARESKSMVNAIQAVQHLAAIATVERHDRAAVRLLGYVEAALARLQSFRERGDAYTRDCAMQTLQQKLTGAEIQKLLGEGAALSDDEAFALAIRVSAPGPDAPEST